MFGFFKKKTDPAVYAPVKGKCIDITEVNDEGFSSKVMGDGVAVIPEEQVIQAPADGRLTMIFPTGHAFGMQTDNGLELLLHIGIDTVNEQGRGFRLLKKSGDTVKKGTPIVELDLEKLKEKYDMTTMVVVTNGKSIAKPALQETVDENTPILVFEGTE